MKKKNKFQEDIKRAVRVEDAIKFLDTDNCYLCGAGGCKTYFVDEKGKVRFHYFDHCRRVVCRKCYKDLNITNFFTFKILIPLVKLKRKMGL